MPKPKDLRELLRPRREKLGMSQYDLQVASGVARADISRIESKKEPLGKARAAKLEPALKLKPGTLYRENGKKANKP